MTAKYVSLIKWWWLPVLLCACAAGPSGRPSQSVRWSVAVLDFENLSPLNTARMDLSELLTAKAIETIEEAGRYDVIERQRLAMVLAELNIGTSGFVDRQSQLRLGEITGVRLMVFGSYQVMENQLRLDVRLVDVESGRVINAVSRVAEEHSLPGWLDTSARSMAALFRY
ncbi:MAG: CsgG/HfaB family protein [Desulfobacteraceae bacterium]|jgi:TolB-like protein